MTQIEWLSPETCRIGRDLCVWWDQAGRKEEDLRGLVWQTRVLGIGWVSRWSTVAIPNKRGRKNRKFYLVSIVNICCKFVGKSYWKKLTSRPFNVSSLFIGCLISGKYINWLRLSFKSVLCRKGWVSLLTMPPSLRTWCISYPVTDISH